MTAFEYVSDPGLNLHHVLYASAFASPRAGDPGRPRAQSLPAELVLRDRPEYVGAVEYYRRQFNDQDLVFDSALAELKTFLMYGHGAVPPGWRDAFEPVRAIYAETDWATHDETNRAWSGEVAERLRPLLPEVLDELQRVLRARLPDGPLRVDTVWVGNAVGAYTTLGPAHVTCSTTHPENQGWAAVEIVLHEASHTLADPLRHAIRDRIGPSRDGFGPLWHAVLFVLTGDTVRRALAGIGVDYQPYVDSTGLFDRAWPQWRQPIMDAWAGYLDGTVDWAEACDRLVAGVAP